MADKNMKLIIETPGFNKFQALTLTTYDANDVVEIPRRFPFADVINLEELKESGQIRHFSQDVTTKYGGANGEDAKTNFGIQLSRTEKLILLVRNSGTEAIALTLSGNKRAGVAPSTIELPAGEAGALYHIDLFDLGFHIEMDERNAGMKITPSAEVDMVLIDRSR